MLEATYILLGILGLAMFGMGFVVTLPEIAIDSPLDLLLGLLSSRRFRRLTI